MMTESAEQLRRIEEMERTAAVSATDMNDKAYSSISRTSAKAMGDPIISRHLQSLERQAPRTSSAGGRSHDTNYRGSTQKTSTTERPAGTTRSVVTFDEDASARKVDLLLKKVQSLEQTVLTMEDRRETVSEASETHRHSPDRQIQELKLQVQKLLENNRLERGRDMSR